MIGIIGVALVVSGLGWMLYRALRDAPVCACGREDCGGGCLSREG